MTLAKKDLTQITVARIDGIGHELTQIPKTVRTEHTRVSRVWSNTGASYDRAQDVEDGEPVESESWVQDDPNPDYQSRLDDLRLIYRKHADAECRQLAGRLLGYSEFRIKRERIVARIVTAVSLIGLLILAWLYAR